MAGYDRLSAQQRDALRYVTIHPACARVDVVTYLMDVHEMGLRNAYRTVATLVRRKMLALDASKLTITQDGLYA